MRLTMNMQTDSHSEWINYDMHKPMKLLVILIIIIRCSQNASFISDAVSNYNRSWFAISFFQQIYFQNFKFKYCWYLIRLVCFLCNFEAIIEVDCCMLFVDQTPTFRADHPFMYFILDSENATQIFAGNFKQHENWILISVLFNKFF